MKILNTAVVVLGENHNPSILHPSFLKAQKIVPSDWEPQEGRVICTPAFSETRYPNSIIFTVDIERLQIKDERPPEDVTKSLVTGLATSYVESLPHVPYKAVGINFAVGIEKVDPGPWMIERFIRPGPWNEDDMLSQSVNLQFQYTVNVGSANLSIVPGQFSIENVKYVGVILTANYHQAIPQAAALEGVKDAINEHAERYVHFRNWARTVIE